jgi:hypothetical protein
MENTLLRKGNGGMMEKWNKGLQKENKLCCCLFLLNPPFQSSNIPLFHDSWGER